MIRSLLNLPNFGFCLALAMMGGIALLSYRTSNSVAVAAEARLRGSMRMDQLQEFLAAAIDIETGERGYVITGDKVFLAPYLSGMARIDSELRGLFTSLADEPSQQRNLAALDEAAARMCRHNRNVVALKASSDDDDAKSLVATGQGKQFMDQVRDLITALRAEQREQLRQGDEQFQAGWRWSMLITMAGSVMGFAAVGLAALAINRSLRERTRLNADLRLALAENIDMLDQLRAAATELTRSNGELEQFAYIASHDLQEPLRKVSSFAQLLAAQYKDKLDADANEFIGYMVDGARRMQVLIQNLLAFSRLGRKGKPFAVTDCNAVLKLALVNLKELIEENAAEITYAPLPIILGDEIQLVQLLQNLIGNAIKFRDAEKSVIRVRAEATGPDWTFSVCDNGIGIDPQFAERIFVIFQRLHNREDYEGTGIGLAFCKKIVERHGGRIWLEAHPGPGATFCFTIPRVAAKESLHHDHSSLH